MRKTTFSLRGRFLGLPVLALALLLFSLSLED
jgi:hypothetical protein